MKKKTVLKHFFMCSLLIAAWLSGCGKQTVEPIETQNIGGVDMSEVETQIVESVDIPEMDLEIVTEQKMTEDFYYIIEDVFALQDRNDVVVVGCNRNSKMYTDTEVDILSDDGRIQTQILGIEDVYAGMVDCVEADSNAGVLLSGVTSDQIKPGDIMVLREQGMVGNEINALISLSPVGEEQTYVEVAEGQVVDVIFYDEQIETTILSKELLEENTDGDMLYVKLELAKPVAYVDNQILYIEDQDGNVIAVGLVVEE